MNDFPLPDYSNFGLRVGMIGCGNIAGFHADVLKAIGIPVSAVCASPNSSRVRAFADTYGIGKHYATWQEMLVKEKCDALWVVAKWDAIDGILLPLLEREVPVMFEKPVALSADKIREAINRYGHMVAKTQVGYNRRFYDFIPRVKKILAERSVKAVEIHIPESSAGIEDVNLVNNLFLQNSSHVLDLLCYLLDFQSVSVEAVHRSFDTRGLPNGYNGFLLIGGHIPAHLVANWNSPCNFGLKFHCEGLMVELLPIETVTVYEGFEIIEPTRENSIRRYKPCVRDRMFMDPVSARFKPGLLNQAINFFETCVLGTRPNVLAADLSSSQKVTELCQQIMAGHA